MREPQVSDQETIDLRDARAFCAVVDLGSITAAADRVGETKGSVSKRVARLERALGAALVRRGPKSALPTDEGVRYRARLRKILELLDEAGSELRASENEPRGKLRVTAPTDFGVIVLAGIVARFVAAYPAVRVEMVATDRVLDLEAQQIDLALRVGSRLRDSTLIARRVLDLELGLWAAPPYLARAGTPRAPKDLAQHAMVTLVASGDPLSLELVRGQSALRTRVQLRPSITGDGAFVREAALASGGIAMLPSLLVERDVAEGKLLRVLPSYRVAERISLTLLHPAARASSAKVRALSDFVVSALSAGRSR